MQRLSEIPAGFRLFATCDHCIREMVEVDIPAAIDRHGDLTIAAYRARLRCRCGQRGAIRIVYHGGVQFAHGGSGDP